jgi:hypothetical protein
MFELRRSATLLVFILLLAVSAENQVLPIQRNLRDSEEDQHQQAIRNNPSPPSSCDIRIDEDKKQIWVGDQVWLTLGRNCVRRNGEELCPTSPKGRDEMTGSDAWGNYQESLNYMDLGQGQEWKLSYRSYENDSTTLLFRQTFLDDLKDTNVPANDTITAASTGVSSWFPSFQISESPESLGYLEFNGMFIGGKDHQIGRFTQLQTNDALKSGPVAIFDEYCVVVMSAATSFMSTSSLFRKEWNEFGYGVMGSITSIPKDYETSTILSAHPRTGPDGIRKAFMSWGAKLQKLHNTNRMKDVTLDYLQYSTDNGAYYYYHKEEGQNYQDTMLGVKEYADKIGLPIRSWLLDSWFYYKGTDSGVKEWTARPDVFPDGLSKVRQEIKWLTMAHNRYWSTENVYAKQNGGDFEFVIEEESGAALPLEEAFWDYFFDQAKQWGLDVYEQDWLNIQTQSMNWTLQTVNGGKDWLIQMGHAAKRHSIPIQYCMSWPRHILQSLQVDAVTQARASDDVLPDNEQSIQLGVTSMISFALGVAPHKDSFWSSPGQMGDPYKHIEHASKLLSIIATYSTGPVAPSDKKERLNVPLIMKSCTQDGTLLKPDIPAVRTDATILAQAGVIVDSEQRNQVWSTRTTLSGFTWTYILAVTSPEFQLTENDLYPSEEGKNVAGYIVWSLDSTEVTPLIFPGTLVPESNRTNPHVYAIAPRFRENGWAFLGEGTTKWTAVSRNRFANLQVDQDGFSVVVTGAPSEIVNLWLTSDDDIISVDCELPTSGTAFFSSIRMACKKVENEYDEEKQEAFSKRQIEESVRA